MLIELLFLKKVMTFIKFVKYLEIKFKSSTKTLRDAII